MRMLGTSRNGEQGSKLMLGAFTLLALLGVLGGGLHEGYSEPELFVIFGSVGVALCYLSNVLGWLNNRPK